MQLLALKAVLLHHLVDKARRRRIIGKVAAQRMNGMLRFKHKATLHQTIWGGQLLSRFRLAATGSQQRDQG